MRPVRIELVEGSVGFDEGGELSVPGTLFSTVGELGQTVECPLPGRGVIVNLVGSIAVRCKASMLDRANRVVFNDSPAHPDSKV